MNRTLKIFFLLLFVSSVSFVYAQEADEKEKGGKAASGKRRGSDRREAAPAPAPAPAAAPSAAAGTAAGDGGRWVHVPQ